jgi:hypothetical protein
MSHDKNLCNFVDPREVEHHLRHIFAFEHSRLGLQRAGEIEWRSIVFRLSAGFSATDGRFEAFPANARGHEPGDEKRARSP